MPFKPPTAKVPRPALTLATPAKSPAPEQTNRHVYNTWRWQKLRARLLRESPLCVHCQRRGRLTGATVLDHIRPINAGGSEWDEANLQGLCQTCHNQKTGEERRLANEGRERNDP